MEKKKFDVEDAKSKMYNWFIAWMGNNISDEELVNALRRKLGKNWFRFFKGDTIASNWRSVANSMRTNKNKEFLKENMQISLEQQGLEIYDSKGVKYNDGGDIKDSKNAFEILFHNL